MTLGDLPRPDDPDPSAATRPSFAPVGPPRPGEPRDRLIVALDLPTAAEAIAVVDRLGEQVLWYKVGMELFYAVGAGLVRSLGERGKRVFLDLKLHDIPNTMAAALRSLALGALSGMHCSLTTLHLPAGRAALEACAAEARKIADDGGGAIGLLGVTRLTSLPPPVPDRPWDDVKELARLAVDAGLYGWIAPAPAADVLRRAYGRDPRLVCPGIRLPDQDHQDQVSVGTPEGAVAAGADWIVVGRPILRARDPLATTREVLRRIGAGAMD